MQKIGLNKFLINIFLVIFLNSFTAAKTDTVIVCFSYNRPLQLEAFLRSLYSYVTGLGPVIIIYRADKPFEIAYSKLKKDYSRTLFWQQASNYKEDFKKLTLQALNYAKSYIMFATDDLLVKDHIDLNYCMQMLNQTGAYGFYLRLGRNIVESYMYRKYTGLPTMQKITNDVYIWKFGAGQCDWAYPNTVDGTIYSVNSIRNFFEKTNYHSPNTLEGYWHMQADLNKFGICFNFSKIINIPINVVQQDINNSYLSKSTSIYELLNLFNAGKRIDIRPLYKTNNRSPHMEYNFSYI